MWKDWPGNAPTGFTLYGWKCNIILLVTTRVEMKGD